MNKMSLVLLSIITVSACGGRNEVNRESFTRAMNQYLDQRGDLCLAKYDWPIDVSAQDFKIGSRDAAQMPVLEKLGLVSSAEATVERQNEDAKVTVAVRRYQLTDVGKKYYLKRALPDLGAAGDSKQRTADFCAAKLSLDQIVGWELPKNEKSPHEATVIYTYRVQAAPWTADAEARRVFPAVARVIEGAGKAQLREAFTLTPDGWRAKDSLN
jgi:hypothetical protein